MQGDDDNMSPGWGKELNQQISPWDLKEENTVHFKDWKLLCRGKITLEDADFIFFFSCFGLEIKAKIHNTT